MKYRHIFYLGNCEAVVVNSDTDNKQSVFSGLSRSQRYKITMRGEWHKVELASSKRDPIVRIAY